MDKYNKILGSLVLTGKPNGDVVVSTKGQSHTININDLRTFCSEYEMFFEKLSINNIDDLLKVLHLIGEFGAHDYIKELVDIDSPFIQRKTTNEFEDNISTLFVWKETPQGFDFWCAVNNSVNKFLEKH